MYRYTEDKNITLQTIGPDIWTLEGSHHVHFRPPLQPMTPYPHRAIVIRLADQSLMIISPIALTDEIRRTMASLGEVAQIISPNAIHHLYLGDWQDAYPAAKLYASPNLPLKRKDLSFSTVLSKKPEPAWAEQVDQVVMGAKGFLPEVVFRHRASNTVILTDFIMDFDPKILTPLTKRTTRINQMYKHTPIGVQLANNLGREQLREDLQTVRNWKAEHLIVAHSPWLCIDGGDAIKELLDNAFDWLTELPPYQEKTWRTARSIANLVIWPTHFLLCYLLDDLAPKLSDKIRGPR